MRQAIVLAAGIALIAVALVDAAEWRTNSFELRRDRLYFPAGHEELVFANAPLFVLRNDDTLYSGSIEHSWEGISISAQTYGVLDTFSPVDLEAIIMQAEIDTARPILVGHDLPGLAVCIDTSGVHRTELTRYNPTEPLREDFLSGSLDAVLTLTDLDPRPAGVTTLAAPLPYIVVLVPNIRRDFNYHGELTTSLYYRFNARNLAVCFRGDSVSEVRRIAPNPDFSQPPRFYDFDPARGKKLLERMNRKPSRLKLHSGHPALDGLARYFADVLARDRCAVELTADPKSADLSLQFISWQDASPRIVFDSLFRMLVQDSVKSSPPAEYLRRIDLELKALARATRAEDSTRHLETAGRIMIEDLGVFPLFRPTLFAHIQERLRDVRLDPSGRVDFGAAFRVRLPEPPAGGPR